MQTICTPIHEPEYKTYVSIDDCVDMELNAHISYTIEISKDGINPSMTMTDTWYGSREELERMIYDTFINPIM